MEYSRNFVSAFPEKIMEPGTKKDIDDSVSYLITQYYSHLDAGDINAANELYRANKTALEKYSIDMAYINRLEEELYNIALHALKSAPGIIWPAEPADQMENGCWYQDY